jgi:hypothetical protein
MQKSSSESETLYRLAAEALGRTYHPDMRRRRFKPDAPVKRIAVAAAFTACGNANATANYLGMNHTSIRNHLGKLRDAERLLGRAVAAKAGMFKPEAGVSVEVYTQAQMIEAVASAVAKVMPAPTRRQMAVFNFEVDSKQFEVELVSMQDKDGRWYWGMMS